MLLIFSDHFQGPMSCNCYLILVMASIHWNEKYKLFIRVNVRVIVQGPQKLSFVCLVFNLISFFCFVLFCLISKPQRVMDATFYFLLLCAVSWVLCLITDSQCKDLWPLPQEPFSIFYCIMSNIFRHISCRQNDIQVTIR